MNKEVISDMSDEISLRPSITTALMDGEADVQLRADTYRQSDGTADTVESDRRCCAVS